ncbi:MAG: hypothetical protein J0M33_13935 [Anaerolineae bacterium]|nr:hypothetical protein [Anaerolineae bacterium]
MDETKPSLAERLEAKKRERALNAYREFLSGLPGITVIAFHDQAPDDWEWVNPGQETLISLFPPKDWDYPKQRPQQQTETERLGAFQSATAGWVRSVLAEFQISGRCMLSFSNHEIAVRPFSWIEVEIDNQYLWVETIWSRSRSLHLLALSSQFDLNFYSIEHPYADHEATGYLVKESDAGMPPEQMAIREILQQKRCETTLNILGDRLNSTPGWTLIGFADPPGSIPLKTDCTVLSRFRPWVQEESNSDSEKSFETWLKKVLQDCQISGRCWLRPHDLWKSRFAWMEADIDASQDWIAVLPRAYHEFELFAQDGHFYVRTDFVDLREEVGYSNYQVSGFLVDAESKANNPEHQALRQYLERKSQDRILGDYRSLVENAPGLQFIRFVHQPIFTFPHAVISRFPPGKGKQRTNLTADHEIEWIINILQAHNIVDRCLLKFDSIEIDVNQPAWMEVMIDSTYAWVRSMWSQSYRLILAPLSGKEPLYFISSLVTERYSQAWAATPIRLEDVDG